MPTKTPSPEKSAASRKRPDGSKRVVEMNQTNAALQRGIRPPIARAPFYMNKGALAIEGLALQSQKRNEIATAMLQIQERNSRLSLFQMPGTNQRLLQTFVTMEQEDYHGDGAKKGEIQGASKRKL